MSFTTEIKNELAVIYPKSACCRRAIGAGIEICAKREGDRRESIIGCVDENSIKSIVKILHEKYKTDITCEYTALHGRNVYKLGYVVRADRSLPSDIEDIFKCHNCAAAFVRGVFLASGSVSDPSSCYHAEFVLSDASSAKTVYSVLDMLGCTPKIVDRPKGIGLYYKNSESIEALLVTIGANNSAFNVMNCKIEREIRNAENRATNCVAKNISKAIEASRRQIEDIETLMASGRFEALPYDIRQTARLRLEYPDVPLVELAALHVPPISKSGLNHRLAKIAEEAKKITEK